MSKLFFDHILSLDDIEKEIAKKTNSHEEKIELWQIVDEIIHHRVIGCILDNLPNEEQKKFLDKYQKNPYSKEILTYLQEKLERDVNEFLKEEISDVASEILIELGSASKRKGKKKRK